MSPVNAPTIGAYIRDQREQARISLRQLAQAAGVSNPYLSQIERGLRRPSADVLQQIAKGLQISAEALYVQAGILEDRPAGRGVRDAVLADPGLTERQKQMLTEIYDSFRGETALAAERSAAAAEAAALTEVAESGTAGEPALDDDLGAGRLADRASGLDDGIDVAGAEVAGLDPAGLGRASGLDDGIDVAGAEVAGSAGLDPAGPDPAGLDPAAVAWPEAPGDWPDDEAAAAGGRAGASGPGPASPSPASSGPVSSGLGPSGSASAPPAEPDRTPGPYPGPADNG